MICVKPEIDFSWILLRFRLVHGRWLYQGIRSITSLLGVRDKWLRTWTANRRMATHALLFASVVGHVDLGLWIVETKKGMSKSMPKSGFHFGVNSEFPTNSSTRYAFHTQDAGEEAGWHISTCIMCIIWYSERWKVPDKTRPKIQDTIMNATVSSIEYTHDMNEPTPCPTSTIWTTSYQ